jgi:hypothetical protein
VDRTLATARTLNSQRWGRRPALRGGAGSTRHSALIDGPYTFVHATTKTTI